MLDQNHGRGAQSNPTNQYTAQQVESDVEFYEHLHLSGETLKKKTTFQKVSPKTIVNKVSSPDLPFGYSMNPYQGCEHGCIYCYARNSHEYWGYSAGSDFESKILVKNNAATLLRKKFDSKGWTGHPILLSGNTDCYQPVERKLEITRSILQVCLEYRNPVGIITKNAMILRDLDILKEMAEMNLVHVVLSITSLNEKLREKLEPRTSTSGLRFNAVRRLSECGVPVSVMMAPVIPAINSAEIMKIAEKAAENGAQSLNHTIVRLNGVIGQLFEEWLEEHYPDRKEKVLNQIKDLHGGELNDSRFKTRMRGEGEYADHIAKMFVLARKKYGLIRERTELDSSLFRRAGDSQLSLF
ncbi:PA0069 family radical SAM protein [Gilvimarinus agarilyticus]|nr:MULTISPECIES: PA0069 family radical SAM protein [Reichenbachiella]MBU2885858.1 PA0069 family radical SAM protein [Gilvimarinus agarilyticus]MBU2915241.1 PA0069 family radical SAM protein [Reichenbachiella agariperforans]RJE70904.1 radical SAM protein [Reichenbachiella sp. MSK19-1]